MTHRKFQTRGAKYYRSDAHRDRNKRSRRTRQGLSSFLPLLVLASMFGAGLLYVAQMNATATGNLTIRQMEQKIGDLQAHNQELELKADTVRSLKNIEQASTALNLVAPAQITYVNEQDSAVALAHE